MAQFEDIPQIQMPQMPRFANVDPGLSALLANASQLAQAVVATPEIRERRDYNKQMREATLQQSGLERDKLQLMLDQAKIAAEQKKAQDAAKKAALGMLPPEVAAMLEGGVNPTLAAKATLFNPQDPNALHRLAGVKTQEQEAADIDLKRAQAEKARRPPAQRQPTPRDPNLDFLTRLDIEDKLRKRAAAQQQEELDANPITSTNRNLFDMPVDPKPTDKAVGKLNFGLALQDAIDSYKKEMGKIDSGSGTALSKAIAKMNAAKVWGSKYSGLASQAAENGVASTQEISAYIDALSGSIGSTISGFFDPDKTARTLRSLQGVSNTHMLTTVGQLPGSRVLPAVKARFSGIPEEQYKKAVAAAAALTGAAKERGISPFEAYQQARRTGQVPEEYAIDVLYAMAAKGQ